ncbi:MAG: ferrous iron transport protein A [Sedimentisphaerales bacterium]|nr:ferrous iron transport protein A [Sedimentisphaerales bacterium]
MKEYQKEANSDQFKANQQQPKVGGAGSNQLTLAQMRSGQKGKIMGINSGSGVARKLDALGITMGKEITKISAQWIKGPILVKQGHTQIAVGFGIASKVLVEIISRDIG